MCGLCAKEIAMRSKFTTKKIALSGLLFALAIVLSFVESMVSPLLGLPPFVKIGLSNIVVMYALFFMGFGPAATLAGLKAFFVLLTRGVVAGWLSLCGGFAALLVMWVLHRLLGRHITYFILSVCGALGHNLGQLAAASVVLSNVMALAYAPVLLVMGLVMGVVTSSGLTALLPALQKAGLHVNNL